MIHRLLSIPLSPSAFQSECDIISELAIRNNIQLDIQKIIRRKLLRQSIRSTSPLFSSLRTERKKWVRLPFLGPSSYRISSHLKHLGYSPSFYSILRVGHLSSLKDVSPIDSRPGVYRATCTAPQCNAVYIGQTGRTLRERISEHLAAYNKNLKDKSAIANHCISCKHHINFISYELIHLATKGRLLNKLEMVETVSAANNPSFTVLNDLSFAYVNPLVTYMYERASGDNDE